MDDLRSVDEKLTAAMKLLDDCFREREQGKKQPDLQSPVKKLLHQQLGRMLGNDDEDMKKSPGRALGQKMMEAAIDEMVAQALLRGRRTSNVLSGLFNLLPGLSGR